MYIVNKIIGYLVSPAGFGMALVCAAILARILNRRRLAGWLVVFALANFWVWSTPLMTKWIGVPLEEEFLVDGRVPSVESLLNADLIEVHGGGMGLGTNLTSYAEMWSSADRVWHATRLWKAGRASKILVTSGNTDFSTGPLLADFGVPKDAIAYDFNPRNTEEEAKAVGGLDVQEFRRAGGGNGKLRVLVVTSAWHMKRTMLMYKKYAPNVEAIPAPCDFENSLRVGNMSGFLTLLPDPGAFLNNSIAFHEWLGYFGYKFFR